MNNLTIIIKKGKRLVAHEGSLYSEHLDIFRNVVNEPPSDIEGIEVWRSSRGIVKVKTLEPSKDGKKFSLKAYLALKAESFSESVTDPETDSEPKEKSLLDSQLGFEEKSPV